MNKFLLVPVLLLSVLMSCTVQKRKHQNGFYVNWSHKKTELQTARPNEFQKSKITSQKVAQVTSPDQQIAASAKKAEVTADLISQRAVISFTDTECDIIVMRNGEEIRAKVSEITSAVVKYKRCDVIDGPLYTTNKSEIFMIKYPNGAKEIMPEPTTTRQPDHRNSTAQTPVSKKDKKLEPLALIGFISVIVSLFLPQPALVLLLLSAGIIMCIVALVKINNNRDTLKGRGWAIAGLIIPPALFLIALMFAYFLL